MCGKKDGFESGGRSESGVLIVTAQVGWHVGVRVAGDVWVGVDACSG